MGDFAHSTQKTAIAFSSGGDFALYRLLGAGATHSSGPYNAAPRTPDRYREGPIIPLMSAQPQKIQKKIIIIKFLIKLWVVNSKIVQKLAGKPLF